MDHILGSTNNLDQGPQAGREHREATISPLGLKSKGKDSYIKSTRGISLGSTPHNATSGNSASKNPTHVRKMSKMQV